jgi:hypothetical protein
VADISASNKGRNERRHSKEGNKGMKDGRDNKKKEEWKEGMKKEGR